MSPERLIRPEKYSEVNFAAGEFWLRLVLRFANEYAGGNLVRFSPSATVAIEGADDRSERYTRENWASAITSGALYAFRILRIPRQHLVVTEFTGRLRACDMDAIANAAAVATAALAEKELSNVTTEGWVVQVQVTERHRSAVARMNSQSSDAATPRLSPQRRDALRSLNTAQLYALVQFDEGDLSAEELEFIRAIAAERIQGGEAEANELQTELSSHTN
jgi:hypothetical protein